MGTKLIENSSTQTFTPDIKLVWLWVLDPRPKLGIMSGMNA